MPKIPEQQFEDELPRFKDLNDGTKLEIVTVEFGETEKNHYKSVTVTLKDGSQIFGTDTGVYNALKQACDEFGTSFEPSDPLVATVDSYVDKFKNTRKKLV